MESGEVARPPRALPPLPSTKTKDVPMNKTRKKKSKASNGVDTLASSKGRSHSESIEPLTPDLQDTAPRKKKKRKKLLAGADLETSFTQHNASDVCNLYSGTDDEVSRKTKKRAKWVSITITIPLRTRPADHSNELEVEEEDIIGDGQAPRLQGPIFAISPGSSQPVDKVFLERSRRFQATDRAEVQKVPEQVDLYMEVKSTLTTRDVSLQAHRGFRVNIADAPMALRRIVTLDPAALASFLYFTALILSLSQQMPSDRLNKYRFPVLPHSNISLWPSGSEFQILHPWIVVNLVVTILVGLAWIFLSYHPMLDYTEELEFGSHVNDMVERDEKTKVQA
ncbi:transmembrane protein 237-like isoform X3 [Heterodontus francisci]|uniref:transmembrane protein 237-like isoform X3 n=1 Tax=Heterodontus francisci TaxID=7792 RepID=UPI00355B7493